MVRIEFTNVHQIVSTRCFHWRPITSQDEFLVQRRASVRICQHISVHTWPKMAADSRAPPPGRATIKCSSTYDCQDILFYNCARKRLRNVGGGRQFSGDDGFARKEAACDLMRSATNPEYQDLVVPSNHSSHQGQSKQVVVGSPLPRTNVPGRLAQIGRY